MKKNRLQNSRIFCERERRSIFERKVWSESKNGEREWRETLASPHSLSPLLDSLQTFRWNIDRRSRSQKIRLFCSLEEEEKN